MSTCRQCGVETEENKSGLCPDCERLDALPDHLADRKTLAGVPFVDMKSVDEQQRIKNIANHLRNANGQPVHVMVDHGPAYQGKGDRYILLITAELPTVQVISRKLGPVKGVETITLRYPKTTP